MKIFCIGRNYAEHAAELKNEIPTEPVIFMKPDTALLRNNNPFFIPEFTKDVHYELEVVVKINRLGKGINKQFASNYYSEIGIGIDFTARDLQTKQKQKGLPWEISKAFDSSAAVSKFQPLGNRDIQNLDFHLVQNGKVVQKGNTADMIFKVDEVISYISQFFMLKIGDLLFTGTPVGVGQVNIGDRLEAYLGDQKLMDFYVK